ncbi:lipoyl(octanoyl) transferase LipB [Thiomicrorhabdus sp. ZW0627]|uniref:lipoyl(octanoyl) transferase LipB n=1 Tax=Thiomicrorhabdus sp. ZW0627 TaxID=3039774 RepID=UPI002437022A|nr:lipoyl(octanoyl) transferase LipB [Thiomicrorhabdus sp. ZW0627]MDG6773505.1 lipoyl(octanoyl) transferase LipB [Thiomicrorhabdus sp. ZW0627]
MQIKHLGLQPYETTWQAMQDFTDNRDASTRDALWIVEHPPVFTQGLNGKAEHLLNLSKEIPLVQTDRGGQVTYHGPGQLIVYVLVDLKRAKLGVRALVTLIEESIIELLAGFGIESKARADAPGVYVNNDKIASLGLKIRQQKSYHGLALNVNMDLSPFLMINPCGLQGMQMAQLCDFLPEQACPNIDELGTQLTHILQTKLNNHTQGIQP